MTFHKRSTKLSDMVSLAQERLKQLTNRPQVNYDRTTNKDSTKPNNRKSSPDKRNYAQRGV